MFFIGRIEQQRADPRVSGDGREIAVAECWRSIRRGSSSTHTSRRLSSVPWLKVSPITGRPRQYSSHASSVLEARWKTERSAAFAPGKIMVSCGSHSSVDLHRGKSAGSDAPAAAAAIELAGAGHGDKRVAFGVQPNGNVQRIAAHNPARRVQQVKVAGFAFG
jgi:hypothetical protein